MLSSSDTAFMLGKPLMGRPMAPDGEEAEKAVHFNRLVDGAYTTRILFPDPPP